MIFSYTISCGDKNQLGHPVPSFVAINVFSKCRENAILVCFFDGNLIQTVWLIPATANSTYIDDNDPFFQFGFSLPFDWIWEEVYRFCRINPTILIHEHE
ncbi:hypothetical protein KJ966_18355 [bacterium]|nr:hypothetical protein [bacterium]